MNEITCLESRRRDLCKSLPLPKEVAKRRALEVELESMNSLDGLPEWPLRLVYKFFRNYDAPYPLYAASMSRLASSFDARKT